MAKSAAMTSGVKGQKEPWSQQQQAPGTQDVVFPAWWQTSGCDGREKAGTPAEALCFPADVTAAFPSQA